MPESAGELMKRLKVETSNLDPFNEDEVVNVFLTMPVENLALAHDAPTAAVRGPLYYVSGGFRFPATFPAYFYAETLEGDILGERIFASFWKAS